MRAVVKTNTRRYHPTKRKTIVYDSNALKNEEVRNLFKENLKTYFINKPITENDNLETTWDHLKENYMKAAENTLPRKKSDKRDWFDENAATINRILKYQREAHEKL